MQKYATYDSNDNHIFAYNFSKTISNDIDALISNNINLTKQVIDRMKGKEYNIKDIYLQMPDFSLVKINELKQIETSFNNFTNLYNKIEWQEIFNAISEHLNNNFKSFINKYILSFGSDFFDRII